eukprot:g3522.t1
MNEPNEVDITPLLGGRLIAMGFPGSHACPCAELAKRVLPTPERARRVKIWNLAEAEASYGPHSTHARVVTLRFSGHPTPPLLELFPLVWGIESWLEQDSANVAIVHCRTGRGRTNTALACVLLWLAGGYAPATPLAAAAFDVLRDTSRDGDAVAEAALRYLCSSRTLARRSAAFPSQARIVRYFSAIVFGEAGATRVAVATEAATAAAALPPLPPPLPPPRIAMWGERAPAVSLRRVIMHGVPTFAFRRVPAPPPCVPGAPAPEMPVLGGCRPFLQLFQLQRGGGEQWRRTLFCQLAGGTGGSGAGEHEDKGRVGEPEARGTVPIPMWVDAVDDAVVFDWGRQQPARLSGDVALHCRHIAVSAGAAGEPPRKTNQTIWRAAFHTGFVPSAGILRLRLEQLDCSAPTGVDARAKQPNARHYPPSLHVDLVFGSEGGSGGTGEREGGGGGEDEGVGASG